MTKELMDGEFHGLLQGAALDDGKVHAWSKRCALAEFGKTFAVTALRADELAVDTHKMDNVIGSWSIDHQRNRCVRVRNATYGERCIAHYRHGDRRRVSFKIVPVYIAEVSVFAGVRERELLLACRERDLCRGFVPVVPSFRLCRVN